MIRRAVPEDYSALSRIWLDASIIAHDFVVPEFWESKIDDMRDIYLPGAETWVVERNGVLIGFLSLVNDNIAALFVDPCEQGRGIGSTLMEKAKELRSNLELSVYKENPRAVAFYEGHGFSNIEERRDVHTSHHELVMKWQK